jgi:hypothetical protein
MTILAGDVKLLASQVMLDVTEGGGAPTAVVINDGDSNAIFPDISELDRAGGRVNIIKVFPAVQTDTVDSYYGANVIVAEPPKDPRVNVTLFSTTQFFDTRNSATTRVESYLNKGPEWAGFLFENHIAGQRIIQLFQRPEAEIPRVGQTIVLVQYEGLTNEVTQYIRATAVSSVIRMFYDEDTQKDYPAAVVSVSLSDALRTDFVGSPPTRKFTKKITAPLPCIVRDTVVADAGTYVGSVPLLRAATLNQFSVDATGVYTQLVPSAQTETPLVDVHLGGVAGSLVKTGSAVTMTLTAVFTVSQNIFIGAGVMPNSLTVTRDAVSATDAGGLLMSAGTQVGIVDYENGVLQLSTNLWGPNWGTYTITYTPAALPELISNSQGLKITAENRSLSYVVTLPSVPAPITLSVSYLAGGRWYVLRDNGAGVVKGGDAAYGVGTLNFSTGSVVVTLGALPDVGSAIIYQWYSDGIITPASNISLANNGKLYVPINTSGDMTTAPGSKPITIGSLIISWTLDGVAKSCHDDSAGALLGDATGIVDYTAGVVYWSPNLLPPAGTTVLLASDGASKAVYTPVGGINVFGGNIGTTNVKPRTISFNTLISFRYAANAVAGTFSPLAIAERDISVPISDDGVGNLFFHDGSQVIPCGTVNYTTGVINMTSTEITLALFEQYPFDIAVSHPSANGFGGGISQYSWNTYVTLDGGYGSGFGWNNGGSRKCIINPQVAGEATLCTVVAGPGSSSVVISTFLASVVMAPSYTLRGVSFKVGSDRMIGQTDGVLIKNPSITTGIGIPCGSLTPSTGVVSVTGWTTGVAPNILQWAGIQAPTSVGLSSPFACSYTILRTASAPIRPSSISVLGQMRDGTPFNVSSDADGHINGTRVKGRVDYEYGTIELWFTDPGGTYGTVDLTSVGIPGVTIVPVDLVVTSSLRYNAVAYSYLPLNAAILGIDPVRLPSDGRVPIFRAGGFVVVGHTASTTPATVTNSQTVNCARVRLSRVRVIGNNNAVITGGYTVDLNAGTVTFTDVTGYSQPVKVEHRIEDMMMASDVQLNGTITFTRALTHDYPLGSYVSSALVAGDLRARVSVVFDQLTWTGNSWLDSVNGTAATATFNNAQFPIVVTNKGALTERWVVQFTSNTSFNVIGENVGVIALGSVNSNCAPINPATGVPYFSIPLGGWGLGWAVGNILRFNTIGSIFPVWCVRTVQQGPETVVNDNFTILVRGDINTP